MKRFLAAFFCLTGFLWAESKLAPSPEVLVFTNVNVVDTHSGLINRNMTVVIKKGRIDAVAKVGLIGQVHNFHVVNATGKYLIPGLWDMHVHSAFSPGAWDEKIIYPLYIANGITGVRDMGGDPNLLEQRRQHIDQGQLIGPHMIMAGPFLDGGKTDPQLIAVTTPEEARAAVDQLKKRGVDFIKILSRLNRETYFAVAQESAKQKLTFVGHLPDSVSASEASAAGQRSIEHLTGILLACSSKEAEIRQQRLAARASHDGAAYNAATTQIPATYDARKAAGLFRQFIDNETWQVPTLVWTQANANLDAPNLKSDPRLKYVPASVRAEWDPEKQLKDAKPEELTALKKEFARDLELVDAMRHAGVPFLAGSDGPDPFVFPGFSLHDELELLVKSGFTPTQALQTATINPALFMAKLDKYGAVDKGHDADLVLLDANPLEDISNTRKIAAVVISGKYYAREDLDKILAQVEDLAAKQ